MVLSAFLCPFSQLMTLVQLSSGLSVRSKFYVWEPPNTKPDWLKVRLTLGWSVFLWVCLINQHNENGFEHKRRNGLA
ncbi:PREDICTED: NADH dehydrogenase [ubiquinone] 1 subunit C1, mitochondrial-like [Chrysochloris asiatica]|uniref:NADH dehydrogenase [ubiquinone] 1 subunit C1, mitochondrial n=1 Tax=Chrysochloris asiatica TaxID=185453 RepID=A0A9B0TL43_CHRAS|nr:PREDICTED: NADH dehydrogenase [ubiquinone] 1 subunit C1, mitochondrial-like [Chrysochloris asiatica]